MGFGGSQWLKTKQELISFPLSRGSELWECLNWAVILPWRLASQHPFWSGLFKPLPAAAMLGALQSSAESSCSASWHSCQGEEIATYVTQTLLPPLHHFPHYLRPPMGFFLLNSSKRLLVQVCVLCMQGDYAEALQHQAGTLTASCFICKLTFVSRF